MGPPIKLKGRVSKKQKMQFFAALKDKKKFFYYVYF
jgi:hypothetical protein